MEVVARMDVDETFQNLVNHVANNVLLAVKILEETNAESLHGGSLFRITHDIQDPIKRSLFHERRDDPHKVPDTKTAVQRKNVRMLAESDLLDLASNPIEIDQRIVKINHSDSDLIILICTLSFIHCCIRSLKVIFTKHICSSNDS